MNLLQNILSGAWQTLEAMSPYLLFGFLVAGFLSLVATPELVEKHLGGHGIWPVIKASLLGVPLPLCSCGVIPVAASLKKHGAGNGAVASFLISTPQTGIDSILVTYGLMGPVFAIFRPLAAFISGVAGGWAINVFGVSDTHSENDKKACTDDCCRTGVPARNALARAFRYAFITLPRDIARPLLLGLLAAGVITALVPPNFFQQKLGSNFVQMLAMLALGIPIYVCATGSVPIAAAMIATGISPGAAFVFLMSGPVTNVAALATIWRMMGRRAAMLYLAVVAITAILCGLALDALITVGNLPAPAATHDMLPGWLGMASAVVLLGLLLYHSMRIHTHDHDNDNHDLDKEHTTFLTIDGMTCGHCAESVQRSISAIPGVVTVKVDPVKGIATVKEHGIDYDLVSKAVDALGYRLTGVSRNSATTSSNGGSHENNNCSSGCDDDRCNHGCCG